MLKIGKEEVNLPSFADEIIIYMENLKCSTLRSDRLI